MQVKKKVSAHHVVPSPLDYNVNDRTAHVLLDLSVLEPVFNLLLT
jgi:hypothetical protein